MEVMIALHGSAQFRERVFQDTQEIQVSPLFCSFVVFEYNFLIRFYERTFHSYLTDVPVLSLVHNDAMTTTSRCV